MSGYKIQPVAGLHDPATGALIGFMGADGNEYIIPALEGPTSNYQDATATPGNVTLNTTRGAVAIAAGASAVTVTNSLVKASSQVVCTLTTADATLTSILRVSTSNGSFTVTGNANATAATSLRFLVVN